jgi:hypothetical protein
MSENEYLGGEVLRPPVSNFKGQQDNLFSLTLLNSAAVKRRAKPECLTLYRFVLRNG